MDRVILDPGSSSPPSVAPPSVNRLLAELAGFAGIGAFLVVLSLSWWSVRLLGLDREMVEEQDRMTQIARIEAELDSVLTLGDLVFYSHRQDFLVPAMNSHVAQLHSSVDAVKTSAAFSDLPASQQWDVLAQQAETTQRILNDRLDATEAFERDVQTQRYEVAAGQMVEALLVATDATLAWAEMLKATRAKAQRARFSFNFALLTAYLIGLVVLWRRTVRMIALPLNRLQASATAALSGDEPFSHQQTGASEVVGVSHHMESLIHHLEGQVEQRTRSLRVQTVRLEEEVNERKLKDTALTERNEELQQALNRLAEMQDALMKKARLEALGQMAGGVAHDFNNALTPIVATSELLSTSRSSLSEEDINESIALIQTAAADAAELIQRLRSVFVGEEEDAFAKCSLDAVASSAVQLARTDWAKLDPETNQPRFQVVQDFDPGVMVWGNVGRLRQAVVNLIVNAVHASPNGGQIRVAIREATNGPILSVQDFGTGMTPEVLQDCLKPLYTTKGSAGTGLGLMNVSATAREHGGRLDIQSEVGVGTTVTLHLLSPPSETSDEDTQPQWTHHAENREAIISRNFPELKPDQQNTPLPASTAGLEEAPRVLLVDDDVTVMGVIRKLIRRAGYHVTSAGSAAEALERLDEGLPDIIVTDQNMPQMTGGELAIEVRSAHPELPILLMTGLRGEAELALLNRGVVNHIVSKPVKMADLFDRINSCVNP